MGKKILTISLFFLLILFISGHAHAIPYEYSISGSAAYLDINGDWVLSGASISGSFILLDPEIIYDYYGDGMDSPYRVDRALYDISDVSFFGEDISLSGTGSFRMDSHGATDSYQYFNLVDNSGNNYSTHLFDYSVWFDPDNIYEHPDTISIISDVCGSSSGTSGGCGSQPDRYHLIFTSTRTHSVPEPSTIILFGTGLLALARFRQKLKK